LTHRTEIAGRWRRSLASIITLQRKMRTPTREGQGPASTFMRHSGGSASRRPGQTPVGPNHPARLWPPHRAGFGSSATQNKGRKPGLRTDPLPASKDGGRHHLTGRRSERLGQAICNHEVRTPCAPPARRAVRAIVLTGAGRGGTYAPVVDMNTLPGHSAGTDSSTHGKRPSIRPPTKLRRSIPNSRLHKRSSREHGACAVWLRHRPYSTQLAYRASVSPPFARRAWLAENGGERCAGLGGMGRPRPAVLCRKVSGADPPPRRRRYGAGLNRVSPSIASKGEVDGICADDAGRFRPGSVREMKLECGTPKCQSLRQASSSANGDRTPFHAEDVKEGVAHFVEKRGRRSRGGGRSLKTVPLTLRRAPDG